MRFCNKVLILVDKLRNLKRGLTMHDLKQESALTVQRQKKRSLLDPWCSCNTSLLPLKNQKISRHFICAPNEIKAPEMIPPIVDDLIELEKGIRMYDANQKDIVLVASLILIINVNDPRHADVSCTTHFAAGHPCRFCFWYQDDRRFAKNAHATPSSCLKSDHLRAHLDGSTPQVSRLELKDKRRVYANCPYLPSYLRGGLFKASN